MSVNGPTVATERQSRLAEDGSLPGAVTATLGLSIAVAVPAAVFGKAVLGVALAPAAAVALFALTRGELRRAVLQTVRGPVGLAMAFFAAFSLVSVLLSDHTPKALEAWSRTLAFVLFGVTVAQVLARDRAALDVVRVGIVIATLLALAYVVLAVFVTDDVLALIALGTEVRTPIALNFKGFASAVVCLVPVVLWASAGPGLARKAMRLCLLVLAALSVWLDGNDISLAAVLGIISALVMMGLVRAVGRLAHRFRILAVAGFLSAALAFAAAVTVSLPSVKQADPAQLSIPTWLVDAHRQYIWAFTVAASEQRPVFGHGPNTINRIEGANRPIPLWRADYLPSHPHNWIYEILSETGPLGLVALCLGLLLLLRHVSILALNGSRAGWAAVALFGTFWGSSLVNFSIWAAWWQLTFVVLMAILIAAAQPSRGGAPSRSHGPG